MCHLRRDLPDQPRVLLVDDEQYVLDALDRALSTQGFRVALAEDGAGALDAVVASPPDVIILDVGLPGLDGLETCRVLRARGDCTPVLMLTAHTAVRERVAGLEAGADDYLPKPFALDELVARLRALLRRADPSTGAPVYGDLILDPPSFSARRGRRDLGLTRTEFRILSALLAAREQVVSREDLYEQIWGAASSERSDPLSAHLATLRRKLEAGGEARLLHTVRGVGLVLRADAS